MRYKGVVNQLSQPIYDTVQAAAAAGQVLSFFTNPLNGVMAGAVLKTYADTNMIQAGRLEKGLQLEITHISVSLRDTATGGARVTLADYLVFYNSAHVNLLIGQTSFLHLPVKHIGSAGEETQYFSNIAAAATEYKVNHGLGSVMNRFPLAPNELILEDQESIEVQITIGGTLAAVTDVTCTLWGNLIRPVR